MEETHLVFHCAGVNRPVAPDQIEQNVTLAQELTAALDQTRTYPAVIFANSVQAGNPTPFGKTKEKAAAHLRSWGQRNGAPVADVRLPNLFGERGRPHYNSVVATFCFLLASGGSPEIIDDRVLPLLHVQDAVELMLNLAANQADGVVEPEGRPILVSALLEKLRHFSDLYRVYDIPDVADPFDRAIFNTYRSYCFPDQFPMYAQLKPDNRGTLFECVRGHGGQSQVFCSTTHSGVTRGNHFHLRKIERFMVLRGQATISLRRLFDENIVRFEVNGDHPSIVDMPTMWTHSITNTSATELMTLFWADEIPASGTSDTYIEPVEMNGASA